MNKRQAKKRERKQLLLYDTGQKSYREAKGFVKWLRNQNTIIQRNEPRPNYWGEY